MSTSTLLPPPAPSSPIPNSDDSTPTSPTPSPLYLIRLSQSHESFRLPELQSLSSYFNIPLKIHEYSATSPFCIVSFPSSPSESTPTNSTPTSTIRAFGSDPHILAKTFISRSILSKAIYELYASAESYEALHTLAKSLPASTWTDFKDVSFKFNVDGYKGKRSVEEQRGIVEGFGYLPFHGRIRMKGAEEEFVVFEEWGGGGDGMMGDGDGEGEEGDESLVTAKSMSVSTSSTTTATTNATTTTTTTDSPPTSAPPSSPQSTQPTRLFFARLVSASQRPLIEKHDLKKRPYISTTSMDAELALLTSLMAHAGPGRLALDPFVGTGGFMVAAAELGAVTLGSDIDGRSFRGKGAGMEKGVLKNFRKYGILSGFGDCVTGDLTNSPFRKTRRRWLDAVICDPPYGVREGLKVLGRRGQESAESGVPLDPAGTETSTSTTNSGPFLIDGVPSHILPGYVAPKRPYSFDAMLFDILEFAARTLVDGGRLAFWMPCANEAGESEFPIPQDPRGLVVLKHVCVQDFNRWSRRLLVYERVAGEVDEMVNERAVDGSRGVNGGGMAKYGRHHADDLNQFRRMYFQGFNQGGSSETNGGV